MEHNIAEVPHFASSHFLFSIETTPLVLQVTLHHCKNPHMHACICMCGYAHSGSDAG